MQQSFAARFNTLRIVRLGTERGKRPVSKAVFANSDEAAQLLACAAVRIGAALVAIAIPHSKVVGEFSNRGLFLEQEHAQHLGRKLAAVHKPVRRVGVEIQAVARAQRMAFAIVFEDDLSGLHHQELLAFVR